MRLRPQQPYREREGQQQVEPRKDEVKIVERQRAAFRGGEVPIGSQFLKYAPEEQSRRQLRAMAIEPGADDEPVDQNIPDQGRGP